MRKATIISIFAAMLCLIAWVNHPQANSKASKGNYVLVFSDEFNGNKLDMTKWSRAERNPSMWARWLSNSDKVVEVKKGRLICKAIPNKYDSKDTASMLTGGIWTRDKHTFKYGKIEVRMRTQLKQGGVPAAWLRNQPQPGSKNPYAEIDIVEVFGASKETQHCIHSQYTVDTPKHKEKNRNKHAIDPTKWHVYSIEWSATNVTWLIDGEEICHYTKPTDKTLLAKGAWTFDTPFYIILNQSVGDGRSFHFIPHLKDTYKTEFDWIRVYKRV